MTCCFKADIGVMRSKTKARRTIAPDKVASTDYNPRCPLALLLGRGKDCLHDSPTLVLPSGGEQCLRSCPGFSSARIRAHTRASRQHRTGQQSFRKNAQLFASIDDDQIAEARTYRFPSLNLYALGSQLLTPVNFTFQQGVLGTFPGIGPVPATNTQIHTPLRPTFYGLTQLSQPLSQQYKFGLNIMQAKLTKLVDEQKLRAQKQSVTSQVKQSYYAILWTQSSLASSEENLKFDRELDRTTEQYLAEKTALKSDSMDVKARIAQEEYNNLTLRNSLANQTVE